MSRALAEHAGGGARRTPGALALHQTFRRPLEAEDFHVATAAAVASAARVARACELLAGGTQEPLWFLADPRRTDVALLDSRSRADYSDIRWGFNSLSTLGGMRPFAVRWYRMPAPGWFAEEGWALTPESAGIARLMGRGPSQGPINAWVRRRETATHVLIGGRHLGAAGDPPVRFAMAVDGRDVAQWESGPGFFLQKFDLPAGTLRGDGLAALTVRALSGVGGSIDTAIEQFDLQPTDGLMWGYEDGWLEAEVHPRSRCLALDLRPCNSAHRRRVECRRDHGSR